MTAEEIRRLVKRLPADSPYFRLGFRGQVDPVRFASLAQRFSLALADPAIGWNLARTYAAAGLRLPTFVSQAAIIRAHGSLQKGSHQDIELALAQQLNLPECKPQRDLVCALLICTDTSLVGIAERCGLELEVITLFECLFWNVLDRRQDRSYIGRICQQIGLEGAKGSEHGKNVLENEHLRIAYRLGLAQSVLDAAGLVAVRKEKPCTQDLHDQILRGLYVSALTGLGTGSLSKSGNPALEPALRIIAARKRRRPIDEKVITGMSLGEALISSLNDIVRHGEAANEPVVDFPDRLPPPPPKAEHKQNAGTAAEAE